MHVTCACNYVTAKKGLYWKRATSFRMLYPLRPRALTTVLGAHNIGHRPRVPCAAASLHRTAFRRTLSHLGGCPHFLAVVGHNGNVHAKRHLKMTPRKMVTTHKYYGILLLCQILPFQTLHFPNFHQ